MSKEKETTQVFKPGEVEAETKDILKAIGIACEGRPVPSVVNACGNTIMRAAANQEPANRALIARGLAEMAQVLVNQIESEAANDAS